MADAAEANTTRKPKRKLPTTSRGQADSLATLEKVRDVLQHGGTITIERKPRNPAHSINAKREGAAFCKGNKWGYVAAQRKRELKVQATNKAIQNWKRAINGILALPINFELYCKDIFPVIDKMPGDMTLQDIIAHRLLASAANGHIPAVKEMRELLMMQEESASKTNTAESMLDAFNRIAAGLDKRDAK